MAALMLRIAARQFKKNAKRYRHTKLHLLDGEWKAVQVRTRVNRNAWICYCLRALCSVIALLFFFGNVWLCKCAERHRHGDRQQQQ